jgi:hypothetical protein
MKRSSILVTVIGSALLMGGTMYKAPRVTASPSLLYLAGQTKMAFGDTSGGLQLISRAARQRESEQQIAIPQAKPQQTVTASKACSEQLAVKVQPAVMAKAEPKKFEKKIEAASRVQPKVLMADMHFPADPFNGQHDVPGMTREQVARVAADYQQQVQRWTERQSAREFKFAKLDKMGGRGRHFEIRVVVPEPPVMSDFPPEPPRTNP